jgi:predicted HD phosphohydrolase
MSGAGFPTAPPLLRHEQAAGDVHVSVFEFTRTCIRQHTSAYVSIRQHTPAYASSVFECTRTAFVKRLGPKMQRGVMKFLSSAALQVSVFVLLYCTSTASKLSTCRRRLVESGHL